MKEENKRFKIILENLIFTVALLLYPLVKINQGLDMADTAYSLANFLYFPEADGTWMSATFLANAAGWALMRLPGGSGLVGINLYTGLLVSAAALTFYFALRKKMSAYIVFAGEMIAIGLCWCPTTILYNYLTYLFMGAGMLFLYKGICGGTDKYVRYLLAAGLCLGANVAVRMPNVVQSAFILALWYGAWLKKDKAAKVLKDTFICLLGYLVGFGIPLAAICVKYGVNAYPAMVADMFAMTDTASDYKPQAMLLGMFGDYIKGLYWLMFAAVCMGFLYIACLIKKKVAVKYADLLYRLLCIAVCLVLLRFYWGRGMFDFDYFYYRCIYQWAVLFLLLCAGCAVYVMVSKGSGTGDKVLALIVLIQLPITPLGSNNALYPMINNLFLAAPFTLWVCRGWFVGTGKKVAHFPWQSMLAMLFIMLAVQSIGFHFGFVFNDGVWGEKRDTLVTGIPKCEGIYTNRENAELLTDLVKYAGDNALRGRKVILYGEIPGLSYLLDMPSAISTSWPDLASYRATRFEKDMEAVELNMEEDRPVVITSAGVAAYISEDAEAYELLGVDEESYAEDEKLDILMRFLDDHGYEETFCNMKYAIYE